MSLFLWWYTWYVPFNILTVTVLFIELIISVISLEAAHAAPSTRGSVKLRFLHKVAKQNTH